MVIITAGMIGVGKTTLTDLIAKHLGTQAFFEPVGENPVLPLYLSLIHISEPTRRTPISYAVFCLKKKTSKKKKKNK